jgi:two-component system, OmpR family, sensor histidine kinase KdpD
MNHPDLEESPPARLREEIRPPAERVLVCVSSSPFSARLVHAARRMAAGLSAEWIALYIETPAELRLGREDRERAARHLFLAERLGARTVVVGGEKVAGALLAYARGNGVTRIVVGKPTHPRWRDLWFGSVLDDVVRGSGDIDVHVITGEDTGALSSRAEPRASAPPEAAGYAWSVAVAALATLSDWELVPRDDGADLILVYLVGVVLIAARFGRGPSALSAALSALAYGFFFAPALTPRALSTFAISLAVALITSSLSARIRAQAEAAGERERRTAALYDLSRELVTLRDEGRIVAAAAARMRDVFDSSIAVLLPDASGRLVERAPEEGAHPLDEREVAVARWVFAHGVVAGRGTDTIPSAKAMYLPLSGSKGVVGVLGVRPGSDREILEPLRRDYLETFANQTALAVERARLVEEAHRARLAMEAEELQSSLLSSVSHDLRTPLAAIVGAMTTFLDGGAELAPATRRELAQAAYEEAERLNRLVQNLLDMTRLESNELRVKKEWQPLEEVIGAAWNRLDARLGGRSVATRLPPDLPLVPIDGVLLEQVFINLLENAIKYTPEGTPIEIDASRGEGCVVVEVLDRGPGFAPGEEERVFEKFYRGERAAAGGAGLGLAICRGIVVAHGGAVQALQRPGSGAVIRFTLPLDGTPPALDAVDAVDDDGEAA